MFAKKHGHSPTKDSKAVPWHAIRVNLASLRTVALKNKQKTIMLSAIMIDSAKNFLELRSMSDEKALLLRAELNHSVCAGVSSH